MELIFRQVCIIYSDFAHDPLAFKGVLSHVASHIASHNYLEKTVFQT